MTSTNKPKPNSLRKIRLICGFTQLEAAEIIGLPDTAQLSRWESGEHLPDLLSALKVSAAYGSTVDQLFRDISWEFRREITPRRLALEEAKQASTYRSKYDPIVSREGFEDVTIE